MTDAALIEPSDLHHALGSPNLRILDATTYLRREVDGGPYVVETGEEGFRVGHIPSALFADIPGELSDTTSPFRFTLPQSDAFAAALGALGVGPENDVVVYSQDATMWATRLWWLLRYFGFQNVQVLNGGLGAWQRAGFSLDDATATYAPANFVAQPRTALLATRSDVETIVANGSECLLNALGRSAFLGETTSYSRAGRIPGSVNVPSQDLLDPTTGRFRSIDDIQVRFGPVLKAVGDGPIVAYCGAGISATVDIFALSLLGRDDVRLYDGSLSEWSADPLLPLDAGE